MSLTLAQYLLHASEVLAASPSPRLDAEVLLMHVTGLTRTRLVTRGHEPLSPEQHTRMEDLIARRTRGEPVAYLTGKREFWSMELQVTPDVLIPRPETELLVELALTRIPPEADWTIADLGTGSGAVALAIARERPHCRIIATDFSAAALDVARANASCLGLSNIGFHQGNWLAPLAGERFDVIVSNPPYVAAGDPHLTRGDTTFEPRAALASGTDGLDAIRCIAGSASPHLRSGGWLMLEHGFDQRIAVGEILRTFGYHEIRCHPDLAGLDRVTVCTVS